MSPFEVRVRGVGCGIYSSYSKGRHVLKFTPAHCKQYSNEVAVITGLIANVKLGKEAQWKLDCYWKLAAMILHDDPLLKMSDSWVFVLKKKHLFDVHHLPDISHCIRGMVLRNPPKSIYMDLLEYSLPYVKHNRLHLPSADHIADDEIINIMRTLLASCLGVFPHAKRFPTWDIRLKLLVSFDYMFQSFTKGEMWNFCNENVAGMRLAMIEFFVYTVNHNMPAEVEFLKDVFNIKMSVSALFENILFIIDNHRQTSFQSDILSWPDVCCSAATSVEKCNRLCKGRQAKRSSAHCSRVSELDIAIFDRAMKMPRFKHVSYARSEHDLSIEALYTVQCLHSLVQVYTLPVNLMREQIAAFLNCLHESDFSAHQSSILQVCLRCPQTRGKLPKMRIMGEKGVCCDRCRSEKTVASVNVLGRIVRVCDTYYYYCRFCNSVHEWKYNSNEFYSCDSQVPRVKAAALKSKCVMCLRQSHAHMAVFDDNLGCMHNVPLCRTHTPLDFQQRYIYNIPTLLHAMRSKLKSVSKQC